MKALSYLTVGIIASITGLAPITAQAAPSQTGGIDVHTHSLKRRCSTMMFSPRNVNPCIEGPISAESLLIKRQYPYTVQRVTTSAEGHTRLNLTAGDYILRPYPSAAVYPLSRAKYIRVSEGSYTPVHLYYRPITIGGAWWE